MSLNKEGKMTTGISTGSIDFWMYGKILFKRRWTIATFFIIVLTLVVIATFIQTPVFRATCYIQIEPAPPEVVSFKEVVSMGSQNYWANKEYYQTQFWIIQSEPLAAEVVNALDLINTDPAFENNPKAARTLTKMISVQPLKNSQLVAISLDHPNAKQAALICNALAESYQQQNIQYKLTVSENVLEWLEELTGNNETILKNAQGEMLNFMKERDIVSFEEKQNIILQKLQDLSEVLTVAQRRRIEAQASYQKAASLKQSGKALQLPETSENSLIQELKTERILLEKKYSEYLDKYIPEHPKMVKLQLQIDLLNKKIDEEIDNIIGALKAAYEIAKDREKELQKAVNESKTEAQYLNEMAIDYGVLKRKVDSEKDVYGELVQRAKETQVTKSLNSNNIIIREKAVPPKDHIKPRRKTNILLGALLGLFGGLALALFLDYLDTTIKSQEDVEQETGLAFLGIIPSFNASDEPFPESELFTHQYPKSSITESVRSIRTNIVFSSPGAPLTRLLVTSAGPQEGKSTTVINLGIIFAQSGNRVLLVDSDLRRPRLHKAFHIKRTKGLTNLIMGEATPEDVILETEVPGLSLITSGPIPPNPSELLGSTKMEEIIKDLEGRFDMILFDSPPIVAVTDAVVLSKKVDGVVLIIKAGKTTTEMVNRAARQLKDVSAHFLGTVLNDFNIKGEGYRYYYYYHHYLSEEGEPEKKRVKKVASGKSGEQGGLKPSSNKPRLSDQDKKA